MQTRVLSPVTGAQSLLCSIHAFGFHISNHFCNYTSFDSGNRGHPRKSFYPGLGSIRSAFLAMKSSYGEEHWQTHQTSNTYTCRFVHVLWGKRIRQRTCRLWAHSSAAFSLDCLGLTPELLHMILVQSGGRKPMVLHQSCGQIGDACHFRDTKKP